MNGQILIRADIGPKVGTGHVMRTAALASAFVKLGGRATMACGPALPGGLKFRLERQGISIASIESTTPMDDAIQTRQLAETLEADWIVADGYRFDDSYQQILKLSLAKLMVIDDFGHGSHHMADLILNQNVYCDGSEYSDVNSERVICGSRFAMLRNEFAHFQSRSSSPRQARRVLLTLGGSDESNFTAQCLKALTQTQSASSLQVDLVVGACNPHASQLKTLSKSLPFTLRIHRNVDRMSTLMKHCDITISGGGSTCYELARCGVPAILLSLADNQRAVAQSFSELECMQWLGDADQVTLHEIANAFDKLAASPKRRREMSRNGARVVDGKGAGRIARRLASEQFTFRDAQIGDADRLLDWRNESTTRESSFQSLPIQPQEHLDWLQRTLNDNLCDLWIVEDEDQEIGQVRFNFDSTGDEATISVSLAPHCRGKNWGTTIIESACRRVFQNDDVDTIIAQIKPNNIASIKAFENAGFIDLDPIAIHNSPAKRMSLSRAVALPNQSNKQTWKKSA